VLNWKIGFFDLLFERFLERGGGIYMFAALAHEESLGWELRLRVESWMDFELVGFYGDFRCGQRN
jgi:hypothetical protein